MNEYLQVKERWKGWWERAWSLADEQGLDLLCMLGDEDWRKLWRRGVHPFQAVRIMAELSGCM